MGSFYEINDSLVLGHDQGFPTNVFKYERHIVDPVTLADVEGKIFHFNNKRAARAFQLDPVRVFLFEYTPNGKWLAWGKVFIQSLTIEHVKDPVDPKDAIKFNPDDWVTSGTYKVVDVYDPEYQRSYTTHEAPAAWNFFAN